MYRISVFVQSSSFFLPVYYDRSTTGCFLPLGFSSHRGNNLADSSLGGWEAFDTFLPANLECVKSSCLAFKLYPIRCEKVSYILRNPWNPNAASVLTYVPKTHE